MTTPESCRIYLESALAEQGVKWNRASEMLGYSHAYIQQYIKNGVPRYLKESDIELLVQSYGLDGDKLKPPRKRPKPPKALPKSNLVVLPSPERGFDIDPQIVRDLLNAPENRRFLGLWIGMDEITKTTALDVLEAISRLATSKKAS